MKKSIPSFILLLLIYSCAITKDDKNDIIGKLNAVYANQQSLYERPIDIPLYSTDLARIINAAINVTKADEERISKSNSPTDKPAIVEGSVFSSLYEGYAHYTIKDINIKNNTAKATLYFEYKDPTPISWCDTVIVVNENGWKIDNVLYDKKMAKGENLKHFLTDMLP